MKRYELMTIYSSEVGDPAAKGLTQEVQNMISTLKGEVEKADFWGKRKFAYEIKSAKEGYYDVITFSMEPENLAKFKNKLRLAENIIRYLVTAKS